jgi:phage gp16-like protein
MTPKARRAAIAKIHIFVKQIGMEDEDYRAMLVNIGRVKPRPGEQPSSTQLTEAGINAVIARLIELGAQPTRPKRAGKKSRMPESKAALMEKVDALLAEARRPMAYADALAKRMFKVDRAAWCNARQLRGVVGELMQDAQRHQRPTE